MKKLRVRTAVELDSYVVISEAVEKGLTYGWTRARKHTDRPAEDQVRDALHTAIMHELCEVIRFD